MHTEPWVRNLVSTYNMSCMNGAFFFAELSLIQFSVSSLYCEGSSHGILNLLLDLVEFHSTGWGLGWIPSLDKLITMDYAM